jgi:hypothetical protein
MRDLDKEKELLTTTTTPNDDKDPQENQEIHQE